jgi:tRNA-intron endonuclease
MQVITMAENIINASMVGSRVLVWSKEDSAHLYKSGFYGKPLNVSKPKDEIEVNAYLELSLIEASFLLEKGKICLTRDGQPVTAKELLAASKPHFRLFDEFYMVYKDLREKGYVVRPALKFGADFAVYKYGPGIDHAPFIIHVLPMSAEVDPIEIVRAGRLSHTVRKKFVLATIDEIQKKVIYFVFMWWRA